MLWAQNSLLFLSLGKRVSNFKSMRRYRKCLGLNNLSFYRKEGFYSYVEIRCKMCSIIERKKKKKKKIKKMKVVGILREHVSEWVYRSPFINSRRGTTSVGRHRPNQTEPARCACLVTPKPRPNALSWFKRSLI